MEEGLGSRKQVRGPTPSSKEESPVALAKEEGSTETRPKPAFPKGSLHQVVTGGERPAPKGRRDNAPCPGFLKRKTVPQKGAWSQPGKDSGTNDSPWAQEPCWLCFVSNASIVGFACAL